MKNDRKVSTIGDFLKYVELKFPNSQENVLKSKAFYHRSLAFSELEDHDGALDDLNTSLTLDPNNFASYRTRGLWYRLCAPRRYGDEKHYDMDFDPRDQVIVREMNDLTDALRIFRNFDDQPDRLDEHLELLLNLGCVVKKVHGYLSVMANTNVSSLWPEEMRRARKLIRFTSDQLGEGKDSLTNMEFSKRVKGMSYQHFCDAIQIYESHPNPELFQCRNIMSRIYEKKADYYDDKQFSKLEERKMRYADYLKSKEFDEVYFNGTTRMKNDFDHLTEYFLISEKIERMSPQKDPQLLFQRWELTRDMNDLDEVIELDPNYLYKYEKGKSLSKGCSADPVGAMNLFFEVMMLKPFLMDTFVRFVELMRPRDEANTKFFAKTVMMFNQYLDRCPNHPGALLVRGYAHMRDRDLEFALRDFCAGIDLQPEDKHVKALLHWKRARCLKLCDYSSESGKLEENNGEKVVRDYSAALSIYEDLKAEKYVILKLLKKRGRLLYTLRHLEKSYNDYVRMLVLEEKVLEDNVWVKKFEILKGVHDCTEQLLESESDKKAEHLLNRAKFYFRDPYLGELGMDDCLKAASIPFRDAGSFCARGQEFSILYHGGEFGSEKYVVMIADLAIKDLSESVRLDPTLSYAYVLRGRVYESMKKVDEAENDYKSAIEHNNKVALSLLGTMYFKQEKNDLAEEYLRKAYENPDPELGKDFVDVELVYSRACLYGFKEEFFESEQLFRSAISRLEQTDRVKLYRLFQRRYEYHKKFLFAERAIEDVGRLKEMKRREFDEIFEFKWNTDGKEMKEQLKKGSSNDLRVCGKFLKPSSGKNNEEDVDIDQIQAFQSLFKVGSSLKPRSRKAKEEEVEGEEEDDLSNFFVFVGRHCIFRVLGSGAFGSAYLMGSDRYSGLLVVKLFHQEGGLTEEKWDTISEKEGLKGLPYHPNVAAILYRSPSLETVNLAEFPNFKKFWRKKLRKMKIKNTTKLKTGIIVMKYYRKDLDNYVKQRKKRNDPFSDLELCIMLKGIVEGAHHLHLHMIVHRDLHLGNIFIDEDYGRIWIGDFGCSLLLKRNRTGFRVHKDHEILFSHQTKDGSELLRKGGYAVHLAPEIVDFCEDEDKDNNFLDYEKSDLFSIGMIAFKLITFRISRKSEDGAFGMIKGTKFTWKKVEKRTNEDFVGFDDDDDSSIVVQDERLKDLTRRLLEVDPKKRIGFSDTKKVLNELIHELEK